MAKNSDIREGMQVYGASDQLLGTVERIHGDGFEVAGQHYSRELVARVAQTRVYVRGTGTVERQDTAATGARSVSGQATDTLRVPVAEERLTVGKREVDRGEATIRKTVIEEQQTVPVTLTYEEVHIEERTVAERPATGDKLFQEETIRVALRGEEAVVTKEAFVTGEVVIEKDAVSEQRQVTDTVRKQRVDVDKAYQEARTGIEQAHTTNAAATGRTFKQAEPNYRAGFNAAHDERHASQEFETAEPELRRNYEADPSNASGGDTWEKLRQEVRQGWDKARGR